jgi:hypothetical protein
VILLFSFESKRFVVKQELSFGLIVCDWKGCEGEGERPFLCLSKASHEDFQMVRLKVRGPSPVQWIVRVS